MILVVIVDEGCRREGEVRRKRRRRRSNVRWKQRWSW